ncbi:MAG: hypothetical protein KF729_16475 [Sandaracinaceae bacterium]|nr:hypothetical protein [Sandaracinaceae bacterium]
MLAFPFLRPRAALAALFGLLAACGGSSHGPDAGVAYGAACGPSVPCAAGLACLDDPRFPGGYCTATCEPGACGAGASCDTSSAPPICLAACEGASDCRDGYQCWRGTCRPRCRVDADCGDAATCAADGRCDGVECVNDADCGPTRVCRASACVEPPPRPDAGPGGSPAGTPCARDDECEGRVCLPAALGGVCSLPCARAEDCFVFPTEAGCSALAAPGAPTVCVLAPPGGGAIGAPCRADEECLARVCQDGQCSEACGDASECVTGMQCTDLVREGAGGATFRGCGYPPLSGASEIYEVDYGRVTIRAGFGEQRTLAAPSDAVSITLSARQTGGDPRDIAFLTVTDPTGRQLFDAAQIVMLVDQPIRWLPVQTFDAASMLIPNTTPDRVAFVPGVHRWAVGPIPDAAGDGATPELHLTALVKRARGGSFTAGRIDLNVFLVGLSGLSAATAESHAKLQGALTRLDTLLAPTGIRVGNVRYFDVAEPDATRYRVIDSSDGQDSELAGLFRLSGRGAARGVNVFLVRSISGAGDGFRALGIAGGIPGPVGLHGTGHSGVVSSFADGVVGTGTTGANVVGHILAHEIGHYVGLYHSTEQARPCGPGETPATADCAPFGGGDQLADTAHGDRGNLMYWSIVGSGTNTALTAGQAHVFRMSATSR